MKAFLSRCLDKCMVPELFEVLLVFKCQLLGVGKQEVLGRIKIDKEIIGFVETRRPGVHLMKFDTSEIGQEDERCIFGRNHIVDLLHLVAQFGVVHPFGRPIRTILLKKSLAVYSIGIADDRERSSLDVGEDRWGEFQVILNKLGFDELVLGPKDFL